jgi:hypothetical protein
MILVFLSLKAFVGEIKKSIEENSVRNLEQFKSKKKYEIKLDRTIFR